MIPTGETVTRYIHPQTGKPCRHSTRGAKRIDEPKLRRFRFGVTTSNGYVTVLKQFGKWLLTLRRMPVNPFVSLAGLNARTDQRHVRRTLSPADFGRLLTVTRQSSRTFRGFDGEARFHLYLLAARSGLRCSELASLTERSFDFDADPPTVTIGASDEKSRRGAVLPLPRDVAVALHQWFQKHQADPEAVLNIDGPSERLLWPGSWIKAAAKMLRQDLREAGIPYADEDGRVFDFHALRSQFITDLSRAGVPLATAQQLARHSDPRLTARNYTRLQLTDLDSAVQQLPTSIPVPLQATGTDGRKAPYNPPVLVTRLVTRFAAKTCDSVSPIESHAADEADEDEAAETARMMRDESDCEGLKEEAQAGFEPANNGFAIRRLRPLGYCALRDYLCGFRFWRCRPVFCLTPDTLKSVKHDTREGLNVSERLVTHVSSGVKK